MFNRADTSLINLGRHLKRIGYRFTTVSPATHSRVNARPGNALAAGLADILGWSRPFEPTLPPEEVFKAMQEAGCIVPDGMHCRSLIRASTIGDQLYFHSAYPTAETDAVFFGPDTYRFAAAIAQHVSGLTSPVLRAIDIGCGGAPGAITVACLLPDAEVLATDINPKALALARVNAALAETGNVQVMKSDLLNDVDGTFDLIVANPPYLIDPAERTYRHGGGGQGEGVSLAIVDDALRRLNPGGSLLLYTGVAMIDGVDHFRLALEERFHTLPVRWCYREIDPDIFGEELENEAYANADRIAAVVLALTR